MDQIYFSAHSETALIQMRIIYLKILENLIMVSNIIAAFLVCHFTLFFYADAAILKYVL